MSVLGKDVLIAIHQKIEVAHKTLQAKDTEILEASSYFLALCDEFEAFYEQSADVGILSEEDEEALEALVENVEALQEGVAEFLNKLKPEFTNQLDQKAWDTLSRRLHISNGDAAAQLGHPTLRSELAAHHRSYKKIYKEMTTNSNRKKLHRQLKSIECLNERKTLLENFKVEIDREDAFETILSILNGRNELAKASKENNFFTNKVKNLALSKVENIESILDETIASIKKPYNALMEELKAEASENNQDLQSADFFFLLERLKNKKLKISKKVSLKKYIDTVFPLLEGLFHIEIQEVSEIVSWNKECKVYNILNTEGRCLGIWHIDYLEREGKYAGAWAQTARSRHIDPTTKREVLPFVFLGFKIQGETYENAEIDFEDTRPILHEFGHALEHCLSEEHRYLLAGTNALTQDVMEISSLFLEKFVSDPELVNLFTTDPTELLAAYEYEKLQDLVYICLLSKIDIELHKRRFESTSELKKVIQNTIDSTGLFHPFVGPEHITVFDHAFWDDEYASTYYCYLLGYIFGENMYSKARSEESLDQNLWFQRFWKEGSEFSKIEAVEKFLGGSPDVKLLFESED